MPVLVGTSGWSYDDWDGTVYPKGLAPGDRLAFVAERFPTVEVDSTFYRDPVPAVVKGWAFKTKRLPAFELSAKLPQTLTHDALVNGTPEQCARMADAWRALVAKPLDEAGRLGAILAQLSPAVTHAREMQARLDAVLAALAPLPVAVEFRNRTWHDDEGHLKRDALALLDARGACSVAVDGPSFPVILEGEAPHAYVRFHGRNRENWFRRDATRDERYDWDYSPAELEPWQARVAQLAREKRVVRVYFNNHVRGKAFRNAEEFESMLEAVQVPVARQRGPQTRLF